MTDHQTPTGSHILQLRYALPLAVLLVGTNVCLDYYCAPIGILLTPGVIPLTVMLISSPTRHSPITKTVLSVLLISLNDVGIKLFGGGMHDLEGQGVFHVVLLIASALAYLILIARILRDKQRPAVKIVGLVLFPLLLIVHLYLTKNLGMGPCINCNY